MSIISQISIILLSLLTVIIILMANRGLRMAEEEGEHFVDEWTLKQQKEELMRQRQELELRQRQEAVRRQKRVPQNQPKKEKRPDNVVPIRQTMPEPFRITVLDENKNVIRVADVDHYPYSIGRDPSNDLVLDDIYIARKHCMIEESNGLLILKNKGSHNKIYAEGKQMDEYPLGNQAHFFLGACEFFVTRDRNRSGSTTYAPGRKRVSL